MDEKAILKDLSDAATLVELQELAITARQGRRLRPTKGLDRVSQEKIDEYNSQFTEEPAGEKDGVKLQYFPADAEPELEAPMLDFEYTDDEIKKLREDLDFYSTHYNTFQENIVKAQNRNKELYVELSNARRSRDKKIQLDIINEQKKLYKDIQNWKVGIAEAEAAITDIQLQIERNNENKSHNEAEKARVNEKNKHAIARYEADILDKNRGRNLNISRMPDETDEDYADRLSKLVNETPFNEERANFEADMKQIQMFKRNMKELIRKENVIEEVLKSFSNNDIFQINKMFPLIKENFLKVFGFDNSNVKSGDIIRVFSLLLRGGKHKGETELLEDEKEDEEEELPVDLESVRKMPLVEIMSSVASTTREIANTYGDFSWKIVENSLQITDNRRDYVLYLKLLNANGRQAIGWSETGEKNSFFKINFIRDRNGPNGANTILQTAEYLNMTADEQNHILGGLTENEVVNRLLSLGLNDVKSSQRKQPLTDKMVFGWGVGLEKLPKIAEFGKVNILLDKLFYKNILSVKDKTNHNIASFQNAKVSDNFVKLIMKLYKNEELKKNDFEKLSTLEKEIYDRLLYVSGLHKKVNDHSIPLTIKNHKERLEVITGEIEAGNNNSQLLKQLYNELHSLYNLGVITITDARRYFKDYKDQYF